MRLARLRCGSVRPRRTFLDWDRANLYGESTTQEMYVVDVHHRTESCSRHADPPDPSQETSVVDVHHCADWVREDLDGESMTQSGGVPPWGTTLH